MSNGPSAAPRLGLVYLAVITAAFPVALDFASVDLAVPALEHTFGLDLESVQWVINGYVLAFAVLMVAGGRLADTYGRRLVFIVGSLIFLLASLLGGAAWNGAILIACRVLQGVGAALLWPASIGMACGAVEERKRPTVIAILFATCAVGNASGPVIGGALTEWFSWRWVLWVNVPLALLSIVMALVAIPRDKSLAATLPRNDYAGAALLTSGLIGLMLLAYQALDWGWTSLPTLGLAALTIILLAAFPLVERKVPEPLIPLDLMRNPEIVTLCFTILTICQIFFILLLYFTQFGMKFLGEDPVTAGARVVQFMTCNGVMSYFSAALVARFGSRRIFLVGLSVSAIALCWLAWCGPGGSWLPFNAALCLLGFGVGAVTPTIGSRAIATAGEARAGLITGVTFMCQLAGAAVMLAINTAIFTAVAHHILRLDLTAKAITPTEAQTDALAKILTGADTIHQIPSARAGDVASLADLVRHAYANGLSVVILLGAALLAVAFFLIWRFVPDRPAERSA